METKNAKYESENKRRYKIIGSKNSASYRTTDNKVLKRFLNNRYYLDVSRTHQNGFVRYLKELSFLDNPNFVLPEVAYVTGIDTVISYLREYIFGTSLGDLYPKTDVNSLINAIDNLYNNLSRSKEFSLDGINAKDIIYTGETLKVTNFDLSSFNYQNNFKHNSDKLDYVIFSGLFGIDIADLSSINEEYLTLIMELLTHKINIVEYLNDYQQALIKSGENPKYIRTLQNRLIHK